MGWWSDLTWLDYFIIGSLLAAMIYKYLKSKYDFFEKRNIPYKKPIPIFGSMLPNLLRLQPITDFVQDVYDEFSEYIVAGFFQFFSPSLMVRDPELVKKITVKDFEYFKDRVSFLPEGIEPLFAANLTTLKGDRWKHMRAILSPAFTSSKMKAMFKLMSECGQQLVDHLETRIKESGRDILEMDMKDLCTRYTNDVIATTAFGITCDSLKNPTNEFYMCGKDMSNFTGIQSLKIAGYFICPWLMKVLNIRLFTEKSASFLYETVRETIAIREKQGIVRPDLIHLMMQARKGELKEDDGANGVDNDSVKPKPVKYDLTDTDITAQAMVFFLAGFETTAVLISFTLIILAMHKDVQERLKEEIDQTLEKTGGSMTYEGINNMKYLDMVISEVLRLYPLATFVERECVKPYLIPATRNTPEIKLHPKDRIFIPIYGFQHDPQYFPDPEKFDPERFSDENKHTIQPFTYFPFGIGPRSCIGNRFALLEDKIAIAFMLSRFSLHLTDKSPEAPLKLAASNFQVIPVKGFKIGLKKRERKY